MPEHHNDSIPGLDTFDTRGIATAPLPAAEVRRLGDRRRARRRTTVSAACAAVVAAAVLPVAILSHDDGPADHSTHVATQAPTPRPTTAAPPRTITFPGGGVLIASAADTSKLVGTSADFKAFIADQAEAAVKDGASCPDAAHGVTVQKYSTGGYASGGVNSCGGYAALWVRFHGTWGEGLGYQDAPDCDALTFLRVPTSFVGACSEEAGLFGTTGTGGPEPGMTRAEAEKAGIVIDDADKAAPPCVATHYAGPVIPRGGGTSGTSTQGLFSPRDGLVRVPMTSSMTTNERVGLGTPRSKVAAAYPNHVGGDDESVWRVPRAGDTSFIIEFGDDDRVLALTWGLNRADCSDYMM